MSAPPNFGDIAKSANDLINKDFYHVSAAALEVKLKSPDGLTITTKGVSPHEHEKKTEDHEKAKKHHDITGSIEAKKVVQKGMLLSFRVKGPPSRPLELRFKIASAKRRRVEGPPKPPEVAPSPTTKVEEARSGGITATGGWTNANVMSAKVELEDILAAGVKAEFLGTFSPQDGLQKQKGNLIFKNGAFHARAFGEFHPTTGNVTTTVDGVVAHEGFLVGGEAGFDVQKAQLTKYAAAFGYHAPTYSMAVTATSNLKLFSASYYHRVNEAVEAGVKAAYDTKSKSTVGIEVASKYKIDPTSFAKFKLNDRGIISLAYNSKINSGFTFGIGASLDSQKLNEAGHKIGTSFTFEG